MHSCPKCGNTHLQKIGFKKTTKGRFRRWVCKNKHLFTGQEKFHHQSLDSKALAVTLAQEGLSIRAIARTVGFFPTAISYWLEKKA